MFKILKGIKKKSYFSSSMHVEDYGHAVLPEYHSFLSNGTYCSTMKINQYATGRKLLHLILTVSLRNR